MRINMLTVWRRHDILFMSMSDSRIHNETISNDTYNYGIGLLKIWMAFEVVLCHFLKQEKYTLVVFDKFIMIAVPVFTLITFYLGTSKLLEQEKTFIKKKIMRLLVPYISWGIIYYIIYSFMSLLNYGELFPSFKQLIWQLSFGSSPVLCPHMWWIWDVIFITVVCFLIFKCFDSERAMVIMAFGGIVALIFQYSGLNYRLFGTLRYELRYTIGRIFELLPYASCGIILYQFRMKYTDKRTMHLVIALSIVCILGCFKFVPFTNLEYGFGYGGLLYLCIAIFLFFLFKNMYTTNWPKVIKKGIKWVQNYSLGIYCIHYGIGILYNAFKLGKPAIQCNGYLESFFIFILSLGLSFMISQIPYAKYIIK